VSKLLKVLLLGCVLTLAAAVPALAQVSVEGERFNKPSGVSVAGGNGYSGGKALRIFSEKAIATKQVTITEASTVDIRARAGQTDGSPTLTLRVDGMNSGTRRIDSVDLTDYVGYGGVTLQPGTYTIGLKGGNLDTGRNVIVDLVTFPVIEDSTSPQTVFERRSAGFDNTSQAWEVAYWLSSDDPEATFECRVIELDETWTPCQGTDTWGDAEAVFVNLPEGTYTFQMRAKDSNGNVDPTPYEDQYAIGASQVPHLEFTSAPTDGSTIDDNTPTIEFTVDDPNAEVRCEFFQLNQEGTAYVPFEDIFHCTSPVTFGPLPDGQYHLAVHVEPWPDATHVGLSAASTAFKVDTTP
jgi:large repetitive protein